MTNHFVRWIHDAMRSGFPSFTCSGRFPRLRSAHAATCGRLLAKEFALFRLNRLSRKTNWDNPPTARKERRLKTVVALTLTLPHCSLSTARGVTFDWATVGNAGNGADNNGIGAVSYSYRISKHEVTNAQYTEFLNAVADTDTNGLYNPSMNSHASGGITRTGVNGSFRYAVKSGRENNPVIYVSFFDSMRFVNWLENGQPSEVLQGSETTEDGVYTIGCARAGLCETRAGGATFFIPSEDEWYKAAYHKNDGVTANYWDYPTSTDAVPFSARPPGSGAPTPSNTVNAYEDDGIPNGYNDGYAVPGPAFSINHLTAVGAYTTSPSPYGTFDQGGNVWEMTETRANSLMIVRGGSWDEHPTDAFAGFRGQTNPIAEDYGLGFRVASIPEPSTGLLLVLATVGVLMRRVGGSRGGLRSSQNLFYLRWFFNAAGTWRSFFLSGVIAMTHQTASRRCLDLRWLFVSLFVTCCACLPTGNLLGQVTFDWAIVGNPGNVPDQLYTFQNPNNLRFGAVDNTFRISKYEVTNDQYTTFLNAVDPTGTNPNSVYSLNMTLSGRSGIDFNAGAANGSKYSSKIDMGDKPVNFVTFFDAMRFTNWLENGQPTGGSGTETGVYTIGNGLNETRAADANFFIPSEDEWYKAAYYQPAAQSGDTDNYWLYPTASNAVPIVATANGVGDVSNPGTNVANYLGGADWNGRDGNVTTVGTAGAGSAGFYGTFDQGGNVVEWIEQVDTFNGSSVRVVRGGSWDSLPSAVSASRRGLDGGNEYFTVGFRVASIPEPSSLLLAALAVMGLLMERTSSD